jgi:hypothetical protein
MKYKLVEITKDDLKVLQGGGEPEPEPEYDPDAWDHVEPLPDPEPKHFKIADLRLVDKEQT